MMFNISEFSAHLRRNRPVPISVTSVIEPVVSQTTEDVSAMSPDRNDIILAAERARAGCWMLSAVISFFAICCVLIGNGLAWDLKGVTPTATASAGTLTSTPMIPTLVMGDIELSIPLPAPGETIGIWVNVDRPTDVEIKYQWTHPEGKGKILEGQGTNSITYQAPIEPGTYKIGVEITAAGVVFRRSVFINVGNAEGS
jgi:hypothetical protein